MEVVSKLKFWKVYALLTVATLFFLGIGYTMIFDVKAQAGVHHIFPKLFGIICIGFGVYSLYAYITQLPVITISSKGINLKSLFWRKQIGWKDIKTIQFTGKNNFRFIPSYRMESIKIISNDGSKVLLFYEHYHNSHVIQQYLRSYHHHQTFPIQLEDKKPVKADLLHEKFEIYKGRPLISFRAIMLWGVLLFSAFIAINAYQDEKPVLPIIIFGAIWYLGTASLCFYIKLSDNYLVVRNYFLPFWFSIYKLSDIQEVKTESKPKWPDCLRITMKSFQYKIFPCGTLRNSDWEAFRLKIQEHDIKATNDFF